MRILHLITVFAVLSGSLSAQRIEKRDLKATSLVLEMPTREESAGTRGAGVVWHPTQKKYYAAFAGNEAFPLAIFDAKGQRMSSDDVNTMADLRGIWYNTKTKSLQANTYSDGGWVSYTLDKNGNPTQADILFEGQNQPDAQSVGAYNPTTNSVYFLSDRTVYTYDAKTGKDLEKNLFLAHRFEFEAEMDPEELGLNGHVVYTGIKGKELAVLYTIERSIVCYNIQTGKYTAEYKLPEGAVEPSAFFNFAYANGMFWLFDMDSRVWKSYK